MTKPTPLTQTEKNRYEICKKQIKDGLQTCFDTGAALVEVREGKYYREDFKTFKDFCADTYQIGQSQAYRLIDAFEVRDSLPASAAKLVTNESQARALLDIPEADRAKLILDVKRSGVPVTAAAILDASCKIENPLNGGLKPLQINKKTSPIGEVSIRSADQKLAEKKASEETAFDEVGFPIPKECLQYFRRSGEIQELLTAVSRIKTKLETKRAEDDVLFRNISQAAANELAMAYSLIANAKPYAVCLNCQGKLKDACRGCRGTGFMAKFAYEHEQVKGLRTIREMVIAKGKK